MAPTTCDYDCGSLAPLSAIAISKRQMSCTERSAHAQLCSAAPPESACFKVTTEDEGNYTHLYVMSGERFTLVPSFCAVKACMDLPGSPILTLPSLRWPPLCVITTTSIHFRKCCWERDGEKIEVAATRAEHLCFFHLKNKFSPSSDRRTCRWRSWGRDAWPRWGGSPRWASGCGSHPASSGEGACECGSGPPR